MQRYAAAPRHDVDDARKVLRMAKGVRFIKRNRRAAGRANGSVVCTLSLPAVDGAFDRLFRFREDDLKLTPLRRFITKQLTHADSILQGAKVKVEAAVRMPSGRLGRKTLGKWQSGQSVEGFLAEVVEAWRLLPKEEGWSQTESVSVSPRPVAKR